MATNTQAVRNALAHAAQKARSGVPKKCICGADISRRTMQYSVSTPDGRRVAVCSDACGNRALRASPRSAQRHDKELDALLRELGIG